MKATVYFDGGGPNGAGQCSIAAAVWGEKGLLAQQARRLGEATNNVAEYEALLLGLRMAHSLQAKELVIRGDSMLVIRQMQGEWRIKDPKLTALAAKASKQLLHFTAWRFEWIRREQNAHCDALGREALA